MGFVIKYTTVNIRQLTSRKGKPWQARAKYKDVYGKWKEVSKILPDAKGKKEANRMTQEWLAKFNDKADLMPSAGRAKKVDEIYNSISDGKKIHHKYSLLFFCLFKSLKIFFITCFCSYVCYNRKKKGFFPEKF